MVRRLIFAVVVCTCLAACDNTSDPEVPGPGNPSGEIQVALGDRLGWTQVAPDAGDLTILQFALYVDGTRMALGSATCGRAGADFECSALLPPLSPGSHTLELASFVMDGSAIAESPRSPPLRVVAVAARSAASTSTSLSVVTAEQSQLTLSLVTDQLRLPSDLVFPPDGSILIAERGGTVRAVRDGRLAVGAALDVSADVQLPAGGLLALAIDPKFDESGLLYALYAASGPRDGNEFIVARFRQVGDTFGERAVLLDRTPASPDGASGALRIGPDGKIYVALDSSSDMQLAGSFAAYNGKVLRLNLDATTPDDQPDHTPILSFDHPQPNALDWQPATGTMWVVDRLGSDAGRLSAVSNDAKRNRAGLRTAYALPAGTGATAATFYRGDLLPIFKGNLFVAAEAGRELMRMRFDATDPSKIVSVERLLKDQIGPVRVVSEGRDGALYVATDTSLYRLAP